MSIEILGIREGNIRIEVLLYCLVNRFLALSGHHDFQVFSEMGGTDREREALESSKVSS